MERTEHIEKQIKLDISVENYVKSDALLVKSTTDSKISHNIADLAKRYGDGPPKFYPETFELMIDTAKLVKKGYEDISDNPAEPLTEISTEELEKLVSYSKSLGVNDIGFTEVDPKLIFKNRAILHKNAIVITMEMDYEQIALAPSRETGHEVHFTYNKLGQISNKIAEYLRKRGFNAQAGAALGGDVDYKHLAEKANMGAIGNHGLLISPKVGPRQRITAIYTSIENLPVKADNPHKWIKEFCKSCQICAKRCPANAIVGLDKAKENQEYIELPKCAKSFANSFGCSVCIKECLFNKSDYGKIYKLYQRKLAN
jgi:epoxyqueuosine reductase QueG